MGTVTVGTVADAVLLDANPLTAITHLIDAGHASPSSAPATSSTADNLVGPLLGTSR